MYKIYQIEYGDTILTIANKTGSTQEEIKMLNGITNDNDLKVGNVIIVPNNANQNFMTYKVKQGDNIYAISNMYGVEPELILLLNGLNKTDYIYPNQEILIPNNNIMAYVTKEGDTLDSILNNMSVSADKLNMENRRIFILPDQLIVVKKDN